MKKPSVDDGFFFARVYIIKVKENFEIDLNQK